MTSARMGTRLRALRETRGLSQDDLARIFGIENRQTVAQIEAGQRRLTAEELVTAVQAFGVPLDHFTSPFVIEGEARFSWRRDNGMEFSDVDAFERKAGEWIGAYRELREVAGGGLPATLPRLGLTAKSSYEEAEERGERIALRLDLGPVPSARLADTMSEKLSTLVLMIDAQPGISGAACLLQDLGAALVNRHEAPGRRNFDLAHELFHVLTWDALSPEHIDGTGSTKAQRRVETMADHFAAALLMPRHVLDKLDGPVTDAGWLNATATALGVSAVALKWRLTSLGRIRPDVAKAFDDSLLRNNGRGPGEMGDPPPLFGRQFMSVMGAGIEKGHVSVRRLAKLLDVTVDELGELFDAHGIERPFDI